MQQAVAFIAAALAAEARGADSKTDVTHLALVVAGVIYYARPFGPSEGRPKILPPSSGRMGDFAIESGQTYVRLGLRLLRSNAKQLAAVFGLYGHFSNVPPGGGESEQERGASRLLFSLTLALARFARQGLYRPLIRCRRLDSVTPMHTVNRT
jgi:hypothetical protein